MLPFKRILCPTDFSEPSFEALKAAEELALHLSAQLFVLHVTAPVPVVPAPMAPSALNVPVYQEELEKAAKESLQKVVKGRVSQQLQVESLITVGDAAGEIIRIAGEKGIDLIVIATHGMTGWRRLIFGSVAEKVVRHASCPVLTIPPSSPEE